MVELSVFETINTQRAIRRFKDLPISDETLGKILNAAIRAPSGANQQPWYFIVIRDIEKKRIIGAWYLEAWNAYYKTRRRASGPAESADHLANNMERVPVLVLVCMDTRRYGHSPGPITRGASIYPAVQNLLLASRALGIGTTLTTLHTLHEDDLKAYLGIPDHIETVALIPMGYPAESDHFGGSRRKPLGNVTFFEGWGQHADL